MQKKTGCSLKLSSQLSALVEARVSGTLSNKVQAESRARDIIRGDGAYLSI